MTVDTYFFPNCSCSSIFTLFAFFVDVLGEKIGRVHVGVQDFKGLHTPHHHGVIAKKTHDRDDVPME